MLKLKKVFALLMFGKPFEWTQFFIDHVQHLGQHGFYFQLYTPHDFKSVGNVQVIKMSIEEFNALTEKKLGVNPGLFITPQGIPSFHVTDFYVMLGAIFEDYLRYADFWGTVGMDCVIGRLDHFVTDDMLHNCDIWTDDIGQFNANFVLHRNVPEVNMLFKQILHWKSAVKQDPCPGCIGEGYHALHVTDEIGMTRVMIHAEKVIRYHHPKYHLIHSHDRLENQNPPKLQIADDCSLWELIADRHAGSRHPLMGREIAYYHFSSTKTWPIKTQTYGRAV